MPQTKTGTAKVTYETQLVPITRVGGDDPSVAISEPTVEAALKEFTFKPHHLGFRFSQAVKIVVKLDDGSGDETFSKEVGGDQEYIIAQKIMNPLELLFDPDLAEAATFWAKMRPDLMASRLTTVFLSHVGKVQLLPPERESTTTFVNLQGEVLRGPKKK